MEVTGTANTIAPVDLEEFFTDGFTVAGNGGNDWLTITGGLECFLKNDPLADGTSLSVEIDDDSWLHATAPLTRLNIVNVTGDNAMLEIDEDGTRLLQINALYQNGNAPSLGSLININDNGLIVHNPNAAMAQAIATVVNESITQGANDGGSGIWTGYGISSATAAANQGLAVAVGSALNNGGAGGSATFNLWFGQRVTATDVLIEYTYLGDTNLDGRVDSIDTANVNSHLGQSTGGTWSAGDVNYDGAVDVSDLGDVTTAASGTTHVSLPALLEGDDYTITMPASDVLAHSALTSITSWTVRWGDGSLEEIEVPTGASADVSATHAYDYFGEHGYPIAIRATGEDAGSNDLTIAIPHVDVNVTPAAPLDLTATVGTARQIDLSWSGLSFAATSYDIWRSTGGAFTKVASTTTDAWSYSASNLSAHTSYTFKVTANNADTLLSDSATVSMAAIDAHLTAGGADSVNEAAQYTLNLASQYYNGEAAQVSQWTVNWNDGSTQQTYNVTNPAATIAATHTFADGVGFARVNVTAVTAASGSIPAFTLKLPATEVVVAPVAPSAVTATAFGRNQIDLTWTDNSQCESGFTILRSDDGGSTYQAMGYAAANAIAFNDTSIEPSTSHQYRISSNSGGSNSGGSSAPTGPATTYTGNPTIFAEPGLNSWESASLTWTYLGGAASGFELEIKDETIGENFHLIAVSGPVDLGGDGTYNASGLVAGHMYKFRLRAEYTDGSVSGYDSKEYQCSINDAPSLNVDVTEDLGSFSDGHEHVRLSWSGVPTEGSSVIVQVRGDPYAGPGWRTVQYSTDAHNDFPTGFHGTPTSWWHSIEPAEGEQGYIIDPGVSGSGSYEYRIMYASATGPSAWSEPQSVSVGELLAGPRLTLTATETSITATWEVDVAAGWWCSTGLSMSDGSDGVGNWPGAVFGDDATNAEGTGAATFVFSKTVTGLQPGKRYYFTASASAMEADIGTGDYSPGTGQAFTSGNVLTGGTAAGTAPAAPSFAVATYDASVPRGRVKLFWANSSNNEANFDIYRSDDGGAWQLVNTVGADVTSYTEPASSVWPWNYKVVARNDDLTSAAVYASTAPIGGPDITYHLLSIRQAILAKWNLMTPQQRAGFTAAFNTSVVNQAGNWDIMPLFLQSVKTPHNSGVLPDGEHTVTVQGHVYEDPKVNYYIYGVWCQLMGASPSWAKAKIRTWRYLPVSLGPANVTGRIAWFDAGYTNDLGSPAATAIPVTPAPPPPIGEDFGPMKWHLGNSKGTMNGSN